jgi:hypothetical protein
VSEFQSQNHPITGHAGGEACSSLHGSVTQETQFWVTTGILPRTEPGVLCQQAFPCPSHQPLPSALTSHQVPHWLDPLQGVSPTVGQGTVPPSLLPLPIPISPLHTHMSQREGG